jgi:hypothetical protein
MRGWSDGIIPLAAAGLALLGGERAHGQTLATHRIPAALAKPIRRSASPPWRSSTAAAR